MVRQVAAYVWSTPNGDIEIPREEFWPACGCDGNYAVLNWESCPVWISSPGGHQEVPTAPDAELLTCGHVLPMRRRRRGGNWYLRPGRMCLLCANRRDDVLSRRRARTTVQHSGVL